MAAYRYPMPNSSEITPESVWLNRRTFMGATAGAALVGATAPARADLHPESLATLETVPGPFSVDAEPNSFDDITSYNNFYEFGTDKTDPARYADALTTRPWTIEVGGMVNNPGTLGMEELLTSFPLEERIYRLRCVEAWSMVIPWVGIPLKDVLARYDLQGSAKYLAIETLVRPEEMVGQRGAFGLDWPYREGLRLDEAMHPLAILAVGLYGRAMPNQNGAPVRLVVPWKYGFKSIKSIVTMRFQEEEPETTWNMLQPSEYGFYANVNPKVDHPRWSQASERVVGAGLFGGRRDTEMFNGYAEEVAGLYAGMDLAESF